MNIKAIYLMQTQKEIDEFSKFLENDIKKEFSLKILENENVLDIDVYWDALHFVLTGSSLLQPVFDNPLSEMLSGTYPFYEESEDYIAYIHSKDIQNIVNEINKVNIYEKTLHLTFKILTNENLYPEHYSEYKEEHDRILREEIRENFNKMKIYFNTALKENKGIILGLI